ncbi:polynucleotidyl transferase ribonuclease H fold, partial [Trifolium medium]|nr:polynucleotidyl transferase ribonuclease H fold [Trifolium medium]
NESATMAGNVAMIVWCIWYNRNNWVWNGVKDTAKEVMQAVHMLGEWRAVNTVQKNNSSTAAATANSGSATAELLLQQAPQGAELMRWQKPRDGCWKCNVDASLSQNPSATGWGWCVRDVGYFIY